MAWVKFDDHFDQHPKLAAVGPLGLALWTVGIAYCNRNLTDGFIPWSVARTLLSWEYLAPPDEDGRRRVHRISVSCGMVGDDVHSDDVIALLVYAGLWDEVEDGYVVHDYEQYQPSRASVEESRARVTAVRSEAGRLGGQANRKQTRSKREANAKQTPSKSEANDQAKRKQNRSPDPDPYSTTSYEVVSSRAGAREDDDDDDFAEDEVPLPVREIRDTVLSKLPQRYQRDPLTIDEALDFARDYAGQHLEVAEAIRACRRENELPFPGNLRKRLRPVASTEAPQPREPPPPTVEQLEAWLRDRPERELRDPGEEALLEEMKRTRPEAYEAEMERRRRGRERAALT